MKFLATLALVFFSATAAFAQDMNFADLYEEHSASVVTIHTATLSMEKGTPKTKRGVGSGFIIENDQILTAAHVVDDASVIQVKFTDGERIRADVVASLDSSDVALLKLRKPHPNPTLAVLGDSDDTRIGSKVFIIGSPFGISQTLSVGHLSGRMSRGMHADGTSIEFLQTDTAINTGNSGGPMFNTDGEVIGIVSFILTKGGGFDGIGFATASNTAQQALKESSGVLAGFEGIMVDERFLLLGGDYILDINGVVCINGHDFNGENYTRLNLEEEAYILSVYRDGEVVQLHTGGPEELTPQWKELDTAAVKQMYPHH